MSIELWLTFVVASIVLLTIPGPTVTLVVSYALGRGRHTGWVTVPGVTLGDLTAMTVSLLGAGVILTASATLFTALKLVGAAYLIWLGIRLWRADPTVDAINGVAKDRGGWAIFWNAFVVTALNPKGIVFFIAFVPQFVVAERPLLPQFIILEVTFLVLAAINVAIWAILAGEMRSRMQSPTMLRLTSRIGGCFLIGAGLLTAVVRRAS